MKYRPRYDIIYIVKKERSKNKIERLVNMKETYTQLLMNIKVIGNDVYCYPYECEEEPKAQEQEKETIKFEASKKYVDCKYQDSYIVTGTRKTKTIGVIETCTNLYGYKPKRHNKRIKVGIFKEGSKTIVSEYVVHENHLLSNCFYVAYSPTGRRKLKLIKTVA